MLETIFGPTSLARQCTSGNPIRVNSVTQLLFPGHSADILSRPKLPSSPVAVNSNAGDLAEASLFATIVLIVFPQ